jgi:hypothetical protein
MALASAIFNQPKNYYASDQMGSSGIELSEDQQMQKEQTEFTLPLSNIESIILVIDSMMAKGGHCSRDILMATVGKAKAIFGWAISAATEFGLVDYEAKEYSLTQLGDTFSTENENDRKKTMREIVLSYQPYNTILLRLKNTPENCLPKSDITKAWYELTKKGNERTREDNTGTFASICQWCGLIENRKKSVILTEEGKAFISQISFQAQKSFEIPRRPIMPIKSNQREPADATPKPQSQTLNQLNTTITINISVDTNEQTAVENLLKIIKALKGETDDQAA